MLCDSVERYLTVEGLFDRENARPITGGGA
jgi:hypothetical protein